MTQTKQGIPFGNYTLLERIASGGMAEIFRAKSVGLGGFEKILAIKRLHPEYSLDDQFVKMLVDEAKITVLLQHPNVVQIYDLGRHEGMYFIAMEFVEGPDLFRVLQTVHDSEKPMPLETACFILSEVCNGLHYAHFRTHPVDNHPLKIIHRDVSPQNILLSWAGEVKIADFGIAKAVQRLTRTEAGVIKGKFYYMSPEQAQGKEVDYRSDIFSAGILLFETLTATPLYEDPGEESVINLVRKASVRSPRTERPDIPKALETIVMKALQKNPDDRFKDGREMARALQQFVADHVGLYTRADFARTMRELFRSSAGLHGDSNRSSVYTPPPHTLNATQLTAQAELAKAASPGRSRLATPRPSADEPNTTPDKPSFDSDSDTEIHALHVDDIQLDPQPTVDQTPTKPEEHEAHPIPETPRSLALTNDEIHFETNAMRLAMVRRLPPLDPNAVRPSSLERQRREKILKTALAIVGVAIIGVTAGILYVLATWSDIGTRQNQGSSQDGRESIIIPTPNKQPAVTVAAAGPAVVKNVTRPNPGPPALPKEAAETLASSPKKTGHLRIETKRRNDMYRIYVDGELVPHEKSGRIAISVGRHRVHFVLFPERTTTAAEEVVITPDDTVQIEL